MKLHAALRLVAGVMLLLSLALTYWVHPNWIFFSAFIGLNLLQSAFTRWCPMITILKKLGFEE
ncbi:YgaP family membrane protein [Flavobacterium sp. W21_SRS_FM6]|uniref:YgaP family membrane protein n=1 Tax=Flavobacterium sp. W21_SRS_FM6 TaxID=3240268 RepID=UPI003F90C7F9